jgi:tetratricopeptide (TPR) repeat protein
VPIDVKSEREALDWFEDRRDELLTAARYAQERGEDEQLLSLAESFAPFFARRSYWSEGEEVLGWAVAAAARSGRPEVHARLLNELGNIHRLQSSFPTAAQELDRAVREFSELEDPVGEARARSNLGLVLRKLGRITTARRMFEQSLELWERASAAPAHARMFGLARAMNNLGMTFSDLDETEAARGLYERALSIRDEIGDAEGLSRTLNNLGRLLASEDPQAAIPLHERALEIRSGLGDSHGVARTQGLLAEVYGRVGRVGEAARLLASAAEIRGVLGDRYGEAQTEIQTGHLALTIGDLEGARTAGEQALTIAEELRAPGQEAEALIVLAGAARLAGNPDIEGELRSRAVRRLREIGRESRARRLEGEGGEPREV